MESINLRQDFLSACLYPEPQKSTSSLSEKDITSKKGTISVTQNVTQEYRNLGVSRGRVSLGVMAEQIRAPN